jgi:protein-tyrosine phosphatase
MSKQYSREIKLEGVLNFRDLGGYKARGGKTVAWRRVFRSGEMHLMTPNDMTRLKEELKIRTVIDLRSARRQEQTGIGNLAMMGINSYSIPLNMINVSDAEKTTEILSRFTSSGEIYLYRIKLKGYGQGMIEALELIASPENHPLVFHCNAGKDRSGILTALLLGALGVAEEVIIGDYVLTAQSLKKFIERWDNDPVTAGIHKNLPAFDKVAEPKTMAFFLTALKNKYGSSAGYLKAQGAAPSLVKRLEKALLV